MPLLETVPNVSEGRRTDVVSRLADALAGVDGAHLLDHSADRDHNRSVYTVAGAESAVRTALLALFETALGSIELARHEGVHPRIGAVDVVPFVPLAGATMDDAILAAERLGEEVAERFEIPVFLYDRAARRPQHRNLADLRRGGLDRLALDLYSGRRRPDYGPTRLHPTAGAVAVGARRPLVAFNAVLDNADVLLARAVAREVRASDGGLPALKAIGVPLRSRGLAQVSMNLVDFRRTALPAALAAVESAAAARGASVLDTEVVGLVPEEALGGVAPQELKLRGFGPDRVLETRLAACGLPPTVP